MAVLLVLHGPKFIALLRLFVHMGHDYLSAREETLYTTVIRLQSLLPLCMGLDRMVAMATLLECSFSQFQVQLVL